MVGKWKPVILFYLLKLGTKRFGEIQKLIPNISKRILTLHLRELEEMGVIGRTVYEVVPPKVEYFITDYGRTLEPILEKMHDWGEKHRNHRIQVRK
ncbi:winged helix-turn-helix transcriptional regulator [Paenibacillus spongiae]|uniref:Winged helix-turn-helix transcriptional regulator n=1 Tax=Paenibacillus spongiae TaxID=2909671 RepID=A0ABY5SM97_9BACL|nr:winged helix-turn-helix transcriptional regulator [Paenibacillus spongiae]